MAHDIGFRDIQVGLEMAWHGLTRIVPEITADNCGIIWPMSKESFNLNQEFQRIFMSVFQMMTDYLLVIRYLIGTQ